MNSTALFAPPVKIQNRQQKTDEWQKFYNDTLGNRYGNSIELREYLPRGPHLHSASFCLSFSPWLPSHELLLHSLLPPSKFKIDSRTPMNSRSFTMTHWATGTEIILN